MNKSYKIHKSNRQSDHNPFCKKKHYLEIKFLHKIIFPDLQLLMDLLYSSNIKISPYFSNLNSSPKI